MSAQDEVKTMAKEHSEEVEDVSSQVEKSRPPQVFVTEADVRQYPAVSSSFTSLIALINYRTNVSEGEPIWSSSRALF